MILTERFSPGLIRRRRQRLGLSQAALARELRWEPSRLSRLEAGKLQPRPNDLIALKQALRLHSLNAFFVKALPDSEPIFNQPPAARSDG